MPDRRRVPPDMYERYGGPPPHMMGHHPREFRPPLHHESGKLHIFCALNAIIVMRSNIETINCSNVYENQMLVRSSTNFE